MKVTLSALARAYLRREAAYLRALNVRSADKFLVQMKTARTNLSKHPMIGFDGVRARLPNMRRMVVGEYYIDYRISGDEVLVAAITSAVNSPLRAPDDSDDDDLDAG